LVRSRATSRPNQGWRETVGLAFCAPTTAQSAARLNRKPLIANQAGLFCNRFDVIAMRTLASARILGVFGS
jgi:hypothetical protein